MVPQWRIRRNEICHDWLKKPFLNALGAFANILDGRVEDPVSEASFLAEVGSRWPGHLGEARALIDDFEREMSPRRLLDEPPLARCDGRDAPWMGEVLHELWLAREPVREWMAEARTRLEAAEEAHARLVAVLEAHAGEPPVAALRREREPFTAFDRACRAFAEAMDEFATEIRLFSSLPG